MFSLKMYDILLATKDMINSILIRNKNISHKREVF